MNGFSPTGINSQYLIVNGDPNPVTLLNVGWGVVNVPEPAAWTMLLLGFAGVGGAMRARRRTAAA